MREDWKYVLLRPVLEASGREFEFEFGLGEYVFDLAFTAERILVEFDGPEHAYMPAKLTDMAKERAASQAGYRLIRKTIRKTTCISPDTILGI